MQIQKYPIKKNWSSLSKRPSLQKDNLETAVSTIIKEVQTFQNKALLKYTLEFDKVQLSDLRVSKQEIQAAEVTVSASLKNAIQIAKDNIATFHLSQKEKPQVIETTKGVKCWRKSVGIQKVGLYIPGGTAPLFSTVLMLGVPAQIAACKEIILCTPPDSSGNINPVILYTANLVGIHKIFKVGGAQAIAAMAYGTESIPKVYKIFGPGNQYVTKAKELVQQDGVAIDMPAGPSEVLVIADQTANPRFVAADLLSQAEHGSDSQVILLSDNEIILQESIKAINEQLKQLPRKEIAQAALANSRVVLLENLEQCFEFSNQYAPEHLIIASENAMEYSTLVENAGSVFLGNYSCESAGDYASGTNHTLPTNGYAQNYSGVSLDSFVKKITFQELSKEGIQNLGPSIEVMAEAEQLMAHKNAVSIRLQELKQQSNV